MLLAQRYPIERVASGIITLWGLTLILTTVCTNYQGLYAQRFFLGVLESGISPMFMMIVVCMGYINANSKYADMLHRDLSTRKMNRHFEWGMDTNFYMPICFSLTSTL
jgi:hypothetical protein